MSHAAPCKQLQAQCAAACQSKRQPDMTISRSDDSLQQCALSGLLQSPSTGVAKHHNSRRSHIVERLHMPQQVPNAAMLQEAVVLQKALTKEPGSLRWARGNVLTNAVIID
jgi:hypothetical protein